MNEPKVVVQWAIKSIWKDNIVTRFNCISTDRQEVVDVLRDFRALYSGKAEVDLVKRTVTTSAWEPGESLDPEDFPVC